MTFLFIVVLVSFLGMALVLWPKLSLVHAEEVSHREHVGLALALMPVYEALRVRAVRVWDRVWVKAKPHVAQMLYRTGSKLHEGSMKLRDRLHHLSDRIHGKSASRTSVLE